MENDKQDWGKAYRQLADLITTKVPEIKHVDLYHEQEQLIDEKGEWIPFPFPAVFLEFNFNATDMAEGRQLLNVDIAVRLAVETLDDTHKGSIGRERALKFIDLLRKLHEALHMSEGDDFGPMTRTGMAKHAAPPYMVFYSQTYATTILDYGGTRNYDEVEDLPLKIEPRGGPGGLSEDFVLVRNTDDSYSVEVPNGTIHTLSDVNHIDSDGNVAPRPAMTPFVATRCIVPEPGTVRNSDASYNDTVEPGGELVLADVDHVDSDGNVAPRPAMTPFVATRCPAPQAARALDADGATVLTIPSGETLPLPPIMLPYRRKSDGAGQFDLVRDALFTGTQLFPRNLTLPRMVVTRSDGTTPVAYADVIDPVAVMPKQPVKNSLGHTVSEHEVGLNGSATDGLLITTTGGVPVLNVPSGEMVSLPQSKIKYTTAAGSTAETTPSNTGLSGAHLEPAYTVPRITIYAADGVTPIAYRDITNPNYTTPANQAPVMRQFTTAGTWTEPTDPRYQGAWWVLVAGGGGGAAGRNSTNTRNAGGSGGGGCVVTVWVPKGSGPLNYLPGAGGIGGVGTLVAGAAGGDTTLGGYVAKGGSGGVSATSTPANTGLASGCLPAYGPFSWQGGARIVGSATTGGSGLNGMNGTNAAPAGGAGGGWSLAGGATTGGAGGGVYYGGVLVAGPAGGAINSAGPNGANNAALIEIMGLLATIGIGTAGAGGGAGGKGGDGGLYGAGGGGGGSQNDTTLGNLNGGNGAQGCLVCLEVY